jgi:hypothetical protein
MIKIWVEEALTKGIKTPANSWQYRYTSSSRVANKTAETQICTLYNRECFQAITSIIP